MPIKMVTLKPHRYGTQRVVGEVYEVPGQSAKRMVEGMKWAKEAEPKPAEPPKPSWTPTRAYTRKVVEPEPVVAAKTTRRSYMRRDLTAEKSED